MIDEATEVLGILGRGITKLLGLRQGENSETFEAGQSVVAAVIAIGVLALTAGLLIYWWFAS